MADIRAEYINFITRILDGENPVAPRDQLDGLLHWLAGRGNQSAEAVATAFEFHNLPHDAARRRTMAYLDATLFARDQDPYRLFGLTPACELAAIRARHKQLMQVFHPDRHDDHHEWFTGRSERVNHAYAYLKAHHGQPASTPRPATVTPPSPTPRRPQPPRTPAPSRLHAVFANRGRLRRQLKTHLGNPASLEKRVYIILVAVPVIFLIVVYVHQTDFSGPGVQVAVLDTAPNTDAADAKTLPDNQHLDADGTQPVEPGTLADADVNGNVANTASAANATDATAGNPGDAIDLPPDPALPVAIQEGAVPPATFAEPGFNVSAASLAAFPVAAAAVEPQAATTGVDSIPEADRTTDIELYPESRAPASVTPVDTGPAIAATATRALDDASPERDTDPAANQTEQTAPDTASVTEQNDTQTAALEPATTDPTATDPTDSDSIASDPTATDQATSDQATTGPSATELSATGSTATESATTASTATTADPQRDEPADQTAAAETAPAEPQNNTTEARDPEPAEQPDLAESDDTQQAARATRRPGLPEIQVFLDQYQSAYNRSDIEHFSRLFHRNATSANANSRAEIAKQYQSLFERTHDRTLALRNVRIHQAGQGAYRVRTHYTVQWTYPDGETKTDSGQFRMLLTTTTGTNLKIQNLDFE